ncbi:hypothetical protein F4780DRAFT_778640 [Xylariomycetidae sp. FL0641]|nr:hypothetical protein F4780DRAFT_778640 [Xylariomycetidae sp. FL0641]
MRFSASLAFSFVPLVATASAVLPKRSTPIPDFFNLYVYGELPALHGAPVFYSESYAWAGDYGAVDDDNAGVVNFTWTDDSTFLGNPASTVINNVTWSDVLFSLPTNDTSNQPVFVQDNNGTTDSLNVTFMLYGNVVMHQDADGGVETKWFATQTETDGVVKLLWDAADVDGAVPVTVKVTKTA